MRWLSLIMLLLVPLGTAIADDPDEDPILIKTVTFQSYKGGASQIILKDDEGGKIIVWQPGFTREEDWVMKWEEGEAFDIVQQRKGVSGLVRARDKKFIKVYFYPDFHPIEVLKQQCFDVEFTTSGMVGCATESAKRWEEEYYYLLNNLKSSLPDELVKAIEKVDVAWVQYRFDALDAYRDHFRSNEGSFGRVEFEFYRESLARNHFHLLLNFDGWR